jgi:hypothetical protein
VAAERGIRGERGQATVEWVGLVLLVAALLAAVLAVGGTRLPGTELARAIWARMACAIALSDSCSSDPELAAAYGPELASLVRAEAPELRYEDGSSAIPVDFRSCRGADCGNGPRSGAVTHSNTGAPVAAFVHVVDCRLSTLEAIGTAAATFRCLGPSMGNLYIQYWLYYEDSTSLRDLPGSIGHHEDDWESYQVRIGPGGTEARASSHHGYDYDGGPRNWLSDAGFVHRGAWGPATGSTYVSGGSHAGHVHEDGDPPEPGGRPSGDAPLPPTDSRPPRWTPADHLALIPIETLAPRVRHTRFAIVPPWKKVVYFYPEWRTT